MQQQSNDDVATRVSMMNKLQGSLFVSFFNDQMFPPKPDQKRIPKIGRKYQEKYCDNTWTYNEGLFSPQ
jgi:hypothetical protein